MIQNIPTDDDFSAEAIELFDLAWNITTDLLFNLRELHRWSQEADEDEALPDDPRQQLYWNSARRRLTTALSLIQQGAEFGIKAKIARVSPMLLLADLGRTQANAAFEDMRTVDAQELVKLHDSVVAEPLAQPWVQRYNTLRSLRNRIMHGVSKDMSPAVADMLDAHLAMYAGLFPERPWVKVRKEMILLEPDAAFAKDEIDELAGVWREVGLAIDALAPAQVRQHFKIDKKARGYKCPACLAERTYGTEFDGHLARRVEATDGGAAVYCPVCLATSAVEVRPCPDCGPSLFGGEDCLRCTADAD